MVARRMAKMKRSAARGQCIHVWRMHMSRARAAEVRIPMVVADDQHDVGWQDFLRKRQHRTTEEQ